MTADRKALTRLQRKLERAELEHLRRHAAELAERLEEAERRIQIAEDRAHNAECFGEMWHGLAMELQEAELQRDPSARIGLTKEGELVRVHA